MIDRVKAAVKYFTSFLKTEWRLEDYPLKATFRGTAVPNGRRKSLPWTVQIINWWHMRGDGDSKQAALEQLRNCLSAHKARHGTLSRPGRGAELEIEVAPSKQIERLADVATDFFPAILGLEYADCLITDESSLWDFHDDATNARFEQRIRAKYGVDVSDLESGNLVEILRRVQKGTGTIGE